VTDQAINPQAPQPGPFRRLLGRFYFNGVFWYRAQYWAANAIPGWILAILMWPFAFAFYCALHSVRNALRRNHRLIDPSAGWLTLHWRALHTVQIFSWCLTERYQQFSPEKRFKLSYSGLENWEKARRDGSGVVVVTSHIGGWEIGSAAAPEASDSAEVHVVREREANPVAQKFVEGLLQDLGGTQYTTHFADEDANLGVELLAALRDGGVVALQGDRPRAGSQVERVEFFDHTVSLPPGPAQLARLAGVPLIPVFTFREGRGHYRVVICDPIPITRSADRRGDVHRAVQLLANTIEEAIREHPLQWFCFSNITEANAD
jgi:lauroyl/myristoyl acyltransferase